MVKSPSKGNFVQNTCYSQNKLDTLIYNFTSYVTITTFLNELTSTPEFPKLLSSVKLVLLWDHLPIKIDLCIYYSVYNALKELPTDYHDCTSNLNQQSSSSYLVYGPIREKDRAANPRDSVSTDFLLGCSRGPSPPCELQRCNSPRERTAATESWA